MKRPLGITMLALSLVLFGLLGVLLAAGGLGILPLGALEGQQDTGSVIQLVITLLMSIAYLVVAVGLWRLQPWARLAAIVVVGLTILSSIATLLSGSISSLLSILILVLVLLYLLLDKEVEAIYGRLSLPR